MTAKLPGLHTQLPPLTRVGPAPPPMLLGRQMPKTAAAAVAKRRCMWELSSNFHCSIVGTCLTTAELREILSRAQLPGCHKASDHELHSTAVLLAGRGDRAAKLLHKALDRRHRCAIGQFSKARNAEDLYELWTRAIDRADIPGAYWALLTHPLASEDLARKVFGEVHMLSHLVGAANRADIRRLRELETENSALRDKVARQQRQLRDAVVSRDATIAKLTEALGKTISSPSPTGAAKAVDGETAAQLVSDLRRRLTSEVAARARLAKRLERLAVELGFERKQGSALLRRNAKLQDELAGAERSLRQPFAAPQPATDQSADLAGLTLLYIGGRAHNIPQLRMLTEECGASFLHHDGGIDDRGGLLAAQVARADRIYFPVDCVSHNAVVVVKRLARQLGKRYLPLRSAGLTSFVLALRREGEALGMRGGSKTLSTRM